MRCAYNLPAFGGVKMGRETALVDAVETETSSVTGDVEGLDVNIITRCTLRNCSYRELKLDNELKVMLISTSAAHKSAATMVLRVGALNDFEELPGIANLVGETVMRLGSETYPQNEFVDFIRANGGKLVGPETTADQQLFGFEVDADSLRPTLERFAQLFIEPRILSDVSKTMLTAIVEEVTKENASAWDIRRRIERAERALGDGNHAFDHSVAGDREIFYQYLREEDGSDQHALPWGEAQQGSGRTKLHDKCIIENKCTKAPTEDTDRNISTISAGIFRIQNIIGLLLSAKSARPIQLISMDSHIENCLKDVCISLIEMLDIVFEAYKTVLLDKQNRAKNFVNETCWNEISTGSHPEFDRTDRIIEELNTLQRETVLDFFREMLMDEHSTQRRKLSVQVFPRKFDQTFVNETPIEATKIDDVIAFKISSSVQALPSPFV